MGNGSPLLQGLAVLVSEGLVESWRHGIQSLSVGDSLESDNSSHLADVDVPPSSHGSELLAVSSLSDQDGLSPEGSLLVEVLEEDLSSSNDGLLELLDLELELVNSELSDGALLHLVEDVLLSSEVSSEQSNPSSLLTLEDSNGRSDLSSSGLLHLDDLQLQDGSSLLHVEEVLLVTG